jgi:anti-sigma B factor antagonist
MAILFKEVSAMAANPSPIPDLKFEVNPTAEEIVVRCVGRISSSTAGELQKTVRSLMPENRSIVLDLTDVNHMDSSGLGTVVGLYVSARRQGCSLRLINLNQRLKDLFRVTRLAGIFEGHQDMLGYTPD